MKKVLIAIDYDQSAQKVANVGFSMAKDMKAEVILLHVISNPVLYYSSYLAMTPIQVNNDGDLKAVSQKFLDKTKHDLGDDAVKTIIKEGDTSDVILELSKKMDVDIIVIGTHSRKWLDNILMGSVAESVLKHTTLPLFIIPTKKA